MMSFFHCMICECSEGFGTVHVLVVTWASHMIGTATKYLDQNGYSFERKRFERGSEFCIFPLMWRRLHSTKNTQFTVTNWIHGVKHINTHNSLYITTESKVQNTLYENTQYHQILHQNIQCNQCCSILKLKTSWWIKNIQINK